MSAAKAVTGSVTESKPAANALAGSSESRATTPLTASQKREQQPLLVKLWSVEALAPKLPFLFPVEDGLPPSPKVRYRSEYRYLGYAGLQDASRRSTLSDFEITLYLIDYLPMEKQLAVIYVQSAKGQAPFHPVSMFLAVCLRRELNLGWRKLARLLASDHGAEWRRLLGFQNGQTPSASGLRHFFRAIGPKYFDELCPRSVDLLRQQGLLPERSTYPGDPADRGVTLVQDGMLHLARNQDCCWSATASCYQPVAELPSETSVSPADPAGSTETPASSPTDFADGPVELATAPPVVPPLGRPCPARAKGHTGCECNTPACELHCQLSSGLDPTARLIHYAGGNDKHGRGEAKNPAAGNGKAGGKPDGKAKESKSSSSGGKNVFGYRSIAERIFDDRFAVAWTLRSMVYPANTDERTVFIERVQAVVKRFVELSIGEVIADAGLGYDDCLRYIWEIGALRMVDIRGHESDRDPEKCLEREFDEKGRPLCRHGYRLRSNGYDFEKRRTKYICAHVCEREPRREGEPVAPVKECPYRDRPESVGQVMNVGLTLPDGSIRLAREIAYGSDNWKARYGRRNNAENRNSQLTGLGLKRMLSYGQDDNKQNIAEVQLADFLVNLRTVGRLVREGTDQQAN